MSARRLWPFSWPRPIRRAEYPQAVGKWNEPTEATVCRPSSREGQNRTAHSSGLKESNVPEFPNCPFCGAATVKVVLEADSALAELDAFLCSTCSNRWCTPRVASPILQRAV